MDQFVPTMTQKAALHMYHIEVAEGHTYRSYEYPHLVELRDELLAAGFSEREVNGNGMLTEG